VKKFTFLFGVLVLIFGFSQSLLAATEEEIQAAVDEINGSDTYALVTKMAEDGDEAGALEVLSRIAATGDALITQSTYIAITTANPELTGRANAVVSASAALTQEEKADITNPIGDIGDSGSDSGNNNSGTNGGGDNKATDSW